MSQPLIDTKMVPCPQCKSYQIKVVAAENYFQEPVWKGQCICGYKYSKPRLVRKEQAR